VKGRGVGQQQSRTTLDLDPDAITWARHADRRTGILHAPLEPTKESGVQARDRLMIKSE